MVARLGDVIQVGSGELFAVEEDAAGGAAGRQGRRPSDPPGTLRRGPVIVIDPELRVCGDIWLISFSTRLAQEMEIISLPMACPAAQHWYASEAWASGNVFPTVTRKAPSEKSRAASARALSGSFWAASDSCAP